MLCYSNVVNSLRTNMKLYHYNTQTLDELKSLYARGLEKEGYTAKDSNPRAYNKSISFFFEPIPLDIGKILNNEHSFWKRGQVLIEHVIDLNSLPVDVPYRITESREVIDLLYNKQNWQLVAEGEPLAAERLRKQYIKEIRDLEISKFYWGDGIDNLKKGLRNIKYDIREDYKNMYKLHKLHPDDHFMSRYASSVPHLMAYVGEHHIPILETKRIVLQ